MSFAVEPIPDKQGFSGLILFGGGFVNVESNTIAGNKIIDIGDEQISSLAGAPNSNSSANPAINFELAYTFGNKRTQLFFGNQLEDWLRFDLTAGFGLRQQAGKSIVEVAWVQAPAVATEVWRDPYVVGVDREETDVDLKGVRVEWDRIGGSGLKLQALVREFELDDEDSGSFLGLTPSERAFLDREGDALRLIALYRTRVAKRQFLVPEIRYQKHDLDGAAMAFDGAQIQLSHVFRAPRAMVVTVVSYGEYENDAVNPVFGVKDEFDLISAGVTVFYDLFHKQPKWRAYVLAAYANTDHEIDFYDGKVTTVSMGATYRF